MRWLIFLALLIASCVDTEMDVDAVSIDETTSAPADRVDRHLLIQLGESANVTDATELFFSSVTGPTECLEGSCFTAPTTAQASLERNGAHTPLTLEHGRFVYHAPFALAYLGSTTNETGVPVGLFRVAEEVPSVRPFGTTFQLAVSSPVTLPNEKTLRLTAFKDARCPCNVQCTWEGLAEVEVTVFSKDTQLGTAKFNDHMGEGSQWGDSTTSVAELALKTFGMRLPTTCEGFVDDGFVYLEANE